MVETVTKALKQVGEYYSGKIVQFGETPRGVDWNGPESQELRFAQLAKLFREQSGFSVSDLGCGYGAFYDFLRESGFSAEYIGVDISLDMVTAAGRRFQGVTECRFFVGDRPDSVADYCVASGIFNVRLECPDEDWRAYIEKTLDIMDRSSTRGFGFNCLTKYSDAEKMRDYLYYADPGYFFDFCKRRYGRNVALLHDYDLYEFTVLVRKN